VLARLNHETVGALCFCAPDEAPAYGDPVFREVDGDFLKAFANEPERLAYRTMLESRLSLNGAVSKIGLARHGDSWLVPMGLEPTTHILKAGSPSFPDQMLNEAICMRCAKACGFDDAAETSLVVAEKDTVLLVSRRFDRAETCERLDRLAFGSAMRCEGGHPLRCSPLWGFTESALPDYSRVK
jgi:serine/threonine-protein kinase HipA